MRTTNWRLLATAVTGVVLASVLPLRAAGAVAGFGDVPAEAFYVRAVQWLDDEDITTGTSPGCFTPDRSVTRGEFATFLWRANGEPAGGPEPFTDVNPGDFFATAVAWMSNNDITTGTSPTTFHPNRPVTRGETATFLWRQAGSPAVTVDPSGTCPTPPPTPPPLPTTPPGEAMYFSTRPPGAELPSGEWCAARIKSAAEIRPANAAYNNTIGTSSNDAEPAAIFGRVDGNFTGTTDEIIQWAACKWGIDEDIARAQTAQESWWDQSAGGDPSSNQNDCHPDLRTGSGECPESIGLLQVRWLYHSEAFEDSNAINSSAYNADYAYAVWRECYEGGIFWFTDPSYVPGDLDGCMGAWFSGQWRDADALWYIDRVHGLLDQRVWEQSSFAD